MTGRIDPPSPGAGAPGGGAPGSEDLFDRLRSMGVVRPRAGRMAGGVCAGLAHRLGVAPILIRAALVLLMAVGGLGLLAYLVALALIPDEDGKILLERAVRHGEGDGIVLLVVIGVLLAGEVSDRAWVWLGIPLAVATWWFVRGAAAGKTPGQLGQEARRFGQSLAGAARGQTTPAPRGSGPQDAPAGEPAYAPGYPRPASAPPTAAPSAGPATSPRMSRDTYPAGAQGLGPGRTFAPTQAVASPPLPRRPRAGFAFFATVVGLGIALVGALTSTGVLVGRIERPLGFALAAAAALAGLALLGAGMRGQRAGGTAFLATVTLGAAVALAYGPATLPLEGGVGERVWTPQAGQVDPTYQLAVGEGTLDLGALPHTGSGTLISASIGLGSLSVKVPQGMTARVEASLGAGDISVHGTGDGSGSKRAGVGGGPPEILLVGDQSRPADVVVRAAVGLGEIVVHADGAVTGGTALAPAPVPSRPATPSPTSEATP